MKYKRTEIEKIYLPNDELTFGKNKGFTLAEVYQYEPTYILYLILNHDTFMINIEAFEELPPPTPFDMSPVAGSEKYANLINTPPLKKRGFISQWGVSKLLNVASIKQFLIDNPHCRKPVRFTFSEEYRLANEKKKTLRINFSNPK